MRVIIAVCVLSALGVAGARADAWQPAAGYTQIPIWPGPIPDELPAVGGEVMTTVEDRPVAGKSWAFVERVSQPTLTLYAPRGANTGIAVVVFPGGGYKGLAIDLEGTEVCDWLSDKGMTCVLLKYRVPFSGPYWDDKCKCHRQPKAPMALEDAQRTVGLARSRALEWHVDPHKIGVMGFSAGGHMVAAISTHFTGRSYPAVDAADHESCRPDFAVALYPGHLSLAENTIALNPDIRDHVSRDTPPTFLLQDEDDHVDSVEDSLSYYFALKKAGVPVEMHLYAQGGHGFGLRRTKLAVTSWPALVERWLITIGMLPTL